MNRKTSTIVYWTATVLFCLQMSFTAYAQLTLPQVAEAFTRLGFPATSASNSLWPRFSVWSFCLHQCRRGSKSGPTPVSRSI